MRPWLLLLALPLALAGCGGGSKMDTTDTGRQIVTGTVPRNATDEQVIRRWADTLRRGDVDGAAAMFAVPTVTQIQPGAPFLLLRTRAQARAFNASLPCGAVLLRTERAQGMTVGVFRLSDRPGATCDGTGAVARTGFVIDNGRITHWIRLADQPGDERSQPMDPAQPDPPLV